MLEQFEGLSNISMPWPHAGIAYLYPRGPALCRTDLPFIMHPVLVRAISTLPFRVKCTEPDMFRTVTRAFQDFGTHVAQPEGGRSLLNPDATLRGHVFVVPGCILRGF